MLKTQNETYEIIPSHSFSRHLDGNCSICNAKLPPNKNVQLHKKKLNKEMETNGFIKFSKPSEQQIFIKVVEMNCDINIEQKLTVNPDYSWKFEVWGKTCCSPFIDTLPQFLDDKNIESFAQTLRCLTLCRGIDDFKDVLDYRLSLKDKNPFPSGDIVTAKGEVLCEGLFVAIKSKTCQQVLSEPSNSILCADCKELRKNLWMIRKRCTDEGNRLLDSSHANISNLSFDELALRYRNSQKSKWSALKSCAKLSLKIDKLVKSDGCIVSPPQQDLFTEIIKKNPVSFDENTPQGLLWQQQLEQASKKSSKGMVWHPLIIRWCLSIYHTSPTAYRQLSSKHTKFMVLPHVNTLKKYINFTTPQTGFNPDVIERMIVDSKLKELKEYQKNVVICFDEMKIRSGLVYRR